MKQKSSLLTLFVLLLTISLAGQSIEGKWKSIDDETGKPKSLVNVEIKDGKLYGTIVKLYRTPDQEQDPLCDECEGALHNKKIIGMQIINGLEKDDGEWEGDDGILDPATGKIYDCKMWVDEENPKKLNVRGYIAFFHRTQTWIRAE